MHPTTKKKHIIKYKAQPPRKRWGFFHGCHFPAHTLFYLTKVNRIKYNKMAINSLQLHIINSRLRIFAQFSCNYLTFLGKKHPPGYLINLLTY